MAKFRTCNHKLPIEVGRWHKVERNERKCLFCKNNIGDEFHFLFECSKFHDKRQIYIPKQFFKNPNTLKIHFLFKSKNYNLMSSLCKFISEGSKAYQ